MNHFYMFRFFAKKINVTYLLIIIKSFDFITIYYNISKKCNFIEKITILLQFITIYQKKK
jgi:hypothetical protein